MIQNTIEHTTNYVTPNIRASTALLYMHIHPLFVVIQVCVRTHVRNPWNDLNIIQQSVTCTSSTDHIVALPNNYTKMNASFRRTSEQKLWTVK